MVTFSGTWDKREELLDTIYFRTGLKELVEEARKDVRLENNSDESRMKRAQMAGRLFARYLIAREQFQRIYKDLRPEERDGFVNCVREYFERVEESLNKLRGR